MDFSEKVKSKKLLEKDMFKEACNEITKSAVGNSFEEEFKNNLNENKDVQLAAALDRVTDYYNMDRIVLSKYDMQDDSNLDTALGITGLTRREVALKRSW